jgi:hypothetical protein
MNQTAQNIRRYFGLKLQDIRWKGSQGTARCPSHDDHRPSLGVTDTGAFCCHACGAEGNLIEFERRISGCSLTTAKKRMAKLANRGGGSELRKRRIVAEYTYRDEEGEPLLQQVRFEPKSFASRHLSDKGEWVWGLGHVRRVPYNLPEILAADEVFVVEGEKDAETLKALGLTSTTNIGGAGKWSEEYSKALTGKKVVVAPDDDEAGKKHARAVAESAARYATEVKLLPPFEDAKDATEWIEKGGSKKALLEIVESTELFQASEAIDSNSNPAEAADTGDWRDECLRGELLVGMHEAFYEDYLVFPSVDLPLVLSLWDIGTYLFDAFDTYPYLCISRPTKRCGKTRLAELLEKLSARGFMNVNVSEAALFRKISRDKPTLILDEAENLSAKGSERSKYLLSILQAGFRKGGRVVRCVGREHDLQEFDVFCPKVIVAIGNLPDTLRDRSVVIPMRRRQKREITARYRFRKVSELAEGAAAVAAVWAKEHRREVENIYSKLDLDFLRDRELDIWEPLFAIASVAVPKRLEGLKRIARSLSLEKLQLDVDDSIGIRLLADIRAVFEKLKMNRVSTDGLIDRLKALPESDWAELNALRLSRILRLFKIGPGQVWIDGTNFRGYLRKDFEFSFETYLPAMKR